jgi:hypothetical protein
MQSSYKRIYKIKILEKIPQEDYNAYCSHYFMHKSAIINFNELLTPRQKKQAKILQVIYSKHQASNSAVIIPKLKAGFVISGLEVLEWAGTLIKMSYFHNQHRKDAFDFRTGYKPPTSDIKSVLSY